MECKRKNKQQFEIRVICFDSAGGQVTLQDRLRFALLTSKWVPKPAGVLLWSALHVLIIVVYVALMLLTGLGFMALGVFLDIIVVAAFAVSLVVGGTWLLICSLLRLSWTLMCERERARQIRAACVRFVEWLKSKVTPRDGLAAETYDESCLGYLWTPSFTSFVFDRYFGELMRSPAVRNYLRVLCEEVVHVHDVISI